MRRQGRQLEEWGAVLPVDQQSLQLHSDAVQNWYDAEVCKKLVREVAHGGFPEGIKVPRWKY